MVMAKAKMLAMRTIFCFLDEPLRWGYQEALSATGQSRSITQCSSEVNFSLGFMDSRGANSRRARNVLLSSRAKDP
jgi:hypothetical protein